MARRRFFVDAVQDGLAALTGDEAQHLTRVLRVEAGQRFEISDNERVWLAEVTEARKSRVEFQVIEALDPGPEPPTIVLHAALFKFDRFEWMIEKVTELGVARIVPVETERSEHGLFAAAQKRVERWRRIVREASQQSRRVKLPVIDDPIKLKHLDLAQDAPDRVRILLDELPQTPPLRLPDRWTAGQPVSLLLGPEGGWTPEEHIQLLTSGWVPGSLGPFVLRAETAGIAALAVLALFMLAPPPLTPLHYRE